MAQEVVIIGDDGREHVFPAGFDPQRAASIVRQSAAPPNVPTPATLEPSMTDAVADALPALGGIIGSLTGGTRFNPLGMTAAGIGGAAGEGYRQFVKHVREIPGAIRDVSRNLVEQPSATMRGAVEGATEGVVTALGSGAAQAGIEGVGRGIVAPVAKGIYAAGMIPLKGLRDKYGLRNLVSIGYKNRIMPTSGGAAKAGRLMEQSKAAQQGMETAYDATGGAPLSTLDAARTGVRPLMEQAYDAIEATGTGHGVPRRIADSVRSVVGRQAMGAGEMGAAKRTADAVADPAYAAARRGGPPVVAGDASQIAKGWSKGYRETLNAAIGPEYAAQGQHTRTLYGVKDMAKYRAEAPNALAHQFGGALALGGVGAATGGDDNAGRALRGLEFAAFASPAVRSGAGLLMTPAALYGTRALDATSGGQMDDLVRQALIERLLSHPESYTPPTEGQR